jgi:mono/diheme cytochrome c family protein
MKKLKITSFLLLIALVVGAVFIYTGSYDIAATTPHSGPVKWLLSQTMRRSVAVRAESLAVPDLSGEEMQLAGVNDFQTMCSGCHTPPGQAPSPLAEGLNPKPPDLAESARHMGAAELFWVTKNGVRMTGMPAWGNTHGDEDLWPVVAFVQRLPELRPEDYQRLLETAKTAKSGHHASDADAHGHDHANESGDVDHETNAGEHVHGTAANHIEADNEPHDHPGPHQHAHGDEAEQTH